MPQAIKLVDAEGRSCIYVPITQDGPFGDVVERLSVYRIELLPDDFLTQHRESRPPGKSRLAARAQG